MSEEQKQAQQTEQEQPERNLRDQVLDIIRTCYDPEIPVNIFDLGLIYEVKVDEGYVFVLMTVTAPNCPAIEMLPQEVKDKVEHLPEVEECTVEITFDPPWDKEMMSDVAKLQLGFM